MEKPNMPGRVKVATLVFVIALLLPILVKQFFTGPKPADFLVVALAALAVALIRPNKQESL